MNTHPRDNKIVFIENTHKYLIENINPDEVISVTTFIHSYFPVFESEKVIEKMRNSENFDDSKYAEMTDQEIIKLWSDESKKSSKLGTDMHKDIENFYNTEKNPQLISKEFEYFLNFNNYITESCDIYRTEWSIYIEEVKLAGQLDALFKLKNSDEFLLCDWKRSKEIKMFNKFEKGLSCLSHLDNCNFIHYSIQLNMYKYILEKYYDIKVSKMIIVILHPNNSDYKMIEIQNMSKEIQDMIDDRTKCLKA